MGRDSYLRQKKKKMARAEFPIQKQQLIESVQLLMMELKRDNPFKEKKPDNTWAVVEESQIKVWAKEVYKYLTAENSDYILKEPSGVFNAGEAAFLPKSEGE
ncbi:hypothetical protein JTB14_019649 [Gonioctena quinquepunctata]|nr:hypothetical protein JTB14_019649 [Gonioctena quinquepunctata]